MQKRIHDLITQCVDENPDIIYKLLHHCLLRFFHHRVLKCLFCEDVVSLATSSYFHKSIFKVTSIGSHIGLSRSTHRHLGTVVPTIPAGGLRRLVIGQRTALLRSNRNLHTVSNPTHTVGRIGIDGVICGNREERYVVSSTILQAGRSERSGGILIPSCHNLPKSGIGIIRVGCIRPLLDDHDRLCPSRHGDTIGHNRCCGIGILDRQLTVTSRNSAHTRHISKRHRIRRSVEYGVRAISIAATGCIGEELIKVLHTVRQSAMQKDERDSQFMRAMHAYMQTMANADTYYRTVPIIVYDRKEKKYVMQNTVTDRLYRELRDKTPIEQERAELERVFRPGDFIKGLAKDEGVELTQKYIDEMVKKHGLQPQFVGELIPSTAMPGDPDYVAPRAETSAYDPLGPSGSSSGAQWGW